MAQDTRELFFQCHRGKRAAEAPSKSSWFYTAFSFLSPPIFPRSHWVLSPTAARCHRDDGRDLSQGFAASRDGQGEASAACGGFIRQPEPEGIGTELRQTIWQRGARTGLEQPRKYFLQ